MKNSPLNRLESRNIGQFLWIALMIMSFSVSLSCKKKSRDGDSGAEGTSQVKTSSGGNDENKEQTKFVSSDESNGQAKAVIRTTGAKTKVLLITKLVKIKGTMVSFPPGSLSEAVDLIVEEGAEVADRRNLDGIGINEDLVLAKGPSVRIMTSQSLDASKAFSVSLVVPEGVDLETLDTSRIAVVSLVRNHSAGGKIFRRVLTGDQLILDKKSGKVSFESLHFGMFQLVILSSPPDQVRSQDEEVLTPLLTAAEVALMPKVDWATPVLKYNMFSRKFEISGQYNSDVFEMDSCSAMIRDQNSADISYQVSDGILTQFSVDVSNESAQKLRGYFRCTDKNGRSVDSPWSEIQTVQEKTNGFSAVINSGVGSVNTKTVSLSFSATVASRVYVTRQADCASGGSWHDYQSDISFTFTEDNTTVTLYFILEDQWGNQGSCTSHSFTHDTIAPTSASLGVGGSATHVNTTNVTLQSSATGASEMYVTNSPGCSSEGTWVSYSTSFAWVLAQTGGTATVYIKFRDEAGNETSCISDTVVHDVTAPTGGSVAISSGNSYSTSSSVTLGLSVTGASEMYITNSSGCSTGGSWETYSTTKTGWTLGSANGTANVYVKFRDQAGNESSCSDDSIVHDSSAPTTPGSFSDGVTTGSTSSSPSLSWSASSDGGSGISSYEIAIGTSAGATDTMDWTDVGNVTSATFSSLSLTWGSTYYASVRSLDAAGNPSSSSEGDGFVPGWLQQAYIKAENNDHSNTGNEFGFAVAISGDTLVVGAPKEDSDDNTSINGNTASSDISAGNAGAVYVYKRSGSTWTQEAYLKAPNSDVEDYFGYSVAIDGDTIVVGAYGEDSDQNTVTNTDGTASSNNTNLSSGAAYIFKRSGVTWTLDAYLKAPNNNGTSDTDEFGKAVAVSGNLVAVGAPMEDHDSTSILTSLASDNNNSSNAGAVYIFRKNTGTGNWEFKSFIKAKNNELGASDQFGTYLSLNSTTLAVGVPLEDASDQGISNGTSASADDNALQSGAVYVYTSSDSGDTWAQQSYIKAINAGSNDNFGASLSLSGDSLVVGAPKEDSDHTAVTNGSSVTGDNGNASNSGAAYVYTRSGSNWSMQAYLKSSNNSTSIESEYGTSVSISGDLIVVGAYKEYADQSGNTNGTGSDTNSGSAESGSGYVYLRTSNSWAQESYLKALNNGSSDWFGFSVAISGETLVCGSYLEDNAMNTIQSGNSISSEASSKSDSGAVYIMDK